MPRAYEKSEKERAKQAREIERRKTALLAGASKYNLTYHIQLNVNNTVINAFYEDTIRRRKRGRPPFGDREECPQRQAWEACLWTFLRKQFMKHDRTSAKLIPIRIFRDKPMGAVVFGWLLEHTYTEDGQYLIHITADENTTFCKGDANNQARWLIFKSGAKMTFFCDDFDKNNRYYIMYTFGGKYSKHIKINHPKGVPLDKRNDFFSFCQSLQKLEMNQIKPENIADGTFSRCYALKSFPIDFDNITSVGKNAFSECSLNKLHMENCLSIDHGAFASNYTDLETVVLPNCKSIGNSAFASCYRLKSVYAPKCTFIDNSAFVSCYNLQEIVVADDCTFGTNCFANCYSLYPRPDGSTN